MAGSNGTHDVRYDYGGDRLTCCSDECGLATFIKRDYMTPERLKRELGAFIAQHPPQNGMITDADHSKPPISVKELIR